MTSATRYSSPLRNTERANPQQMWRRARWLLLLTILIPGSAQLVAGSRRLARIGIFATLLGWAALISAGLLYLVNRGWLVSILATPFVDIALAVILGVAALLGLIITLDTLRLIQLTRLFKPARWVTLGALLGILATGPGGLAYAATVAGTTATVMGEVFSNPGITLPADGRYNILMLGGDAARDRFGLRPDSISVLSIDAVTGQAVNIGIPRNLQRAPWVKGSPMHEVHPGGWRCGDVCLINAIYKDVMDRHTELYPDAEANHSTPGVEATKDAVEGVTGLKIQSYVLVDMAGFKSLIDSLGGVTIDVKKRLPIGGQEDAYGQPINVKGWIEPGVQHMNGETALWYARARHGSSDYDRMARQREVMNAVLKQVEPATLIARFQKVARAGTKMVHTDIPAAMVGTYVDLGLKAKAQGITPLNLVPPKIDVVYPNFSEIKAMIRSALAAKPADQ